MITNDPQKIAAATHSAVAAIYFADNSDYLPALWNIIRSLSPELYDLLQNDEAKAFALSYKEANGEEIDA